jgi:thymidylate synthase (FAD)
VARQWIRHRTANVNEYSGRYSIMKDEFYFPAPEAIRYQSRANKQGRSDDDLPEEIQREFLDHLRALCESSYARYEEQIDQGLARELARIGLPLSLYTEWYWKIDLHNLFHFLRLRLDPHAQQEIRAYAEVMADMVKAVCPVAYEAFVDYSLESVGFSGPELRILDDRLSDFAPELDELVARGLSKREAREFSDKLAFIRRLKNA